MAFFALLWKARTIEKYRLNYEKEKINSIVTGHTQMEQTLTQKWRHYRYDTKKRISRTFKRWYPDGSGVSNFFLYLRTDQTFPNFLLKSVMGFVGGIVLTYLCFMFFVFQLSISLIHATIMSSIIGVLLTLGLAFSYRIRCLVFLLIPQFFSRVGRYTLTCYALVLILTGPATNTLKNSEVLSESMACSQEQIKTSVHQLDDLMKKPYNVMKDSIKLMVDRMKVITMKVKETVVKLDRLVLSLVSIIQSSFSWLQSVADVCNAKLGTPYDRCYNALQESIASCSKSMGSDIAMFCNVAYVAQAACYTVKPFKAFCYVTEFMDEAIFASVKKKLRNFTEKLRAMFHVEVHIQHSYSFSSNTSRSASQVAAGIVTEIRNRADPLLTWLSWSSCVTSLFLLLIIFRAKYYQHMYETRSRFDNRYVTKELQELDLKRQRQGRETVLPLNRRERAKYITTTSFRLVASEKVYLNRSAVFMAITTFKLLIHMVADYSLYWVLMTIRYHGRYQSDLMPGIPHSGVHVSGNGFVARLFRSIVSTLDIPLMSPAPSPISCLPDPYPPDFRRYTQIGVLIFLLWFFALFEPYGLRLRHLIMGHYRPERAKARATWLYNHILRTRAGFMRFARRKLHREYKYTSEASLTFRRWIEDHIPFQFLKSLLGFGPKQLHCLLCGTTSYPSDPDSQLSRCRTPKCPGVFCMSCFTDIGQLCTICLTPADYGDFSDVSLEKGSSDDSDSDGGWGELKPTDAHTMLLINKDSNRSSKETDGDNRRWTFFTKTGPIQPLDATLLPNSNNYNRDLIIDSFRNRLQKMKSSMKIRNWNNKYTKDWISKLSPDIICKDFSTEDNNYDFYSNSLDREQYGVFETTKMKSIGVNTDKNRGVLINALINSFTRRRTRRIYARKKKKNKTNVTRKKELSLLFQHKETEDYNNNKPIKPNKRSLIMNRTFHAHNLVVCQRNMKKIIRNRKDRIKDNVNIYKEVKGILKAIRYFMKNNEIVTFKNKNNDTTLNNPPIEKNDKITKPLDNPNHGGRRNKKKFSKTNKPKRPRKQKDYSKIKVKNSHHRIAEFHSFFSNHWNNFKYTIMPCTNIQNRSDSPMAKEKRNHKRRKKRKGRLDLNETDVEECFARKDNKHTRNLRISAFLAELEWTKRDYKKDKQEGFEESFFFTDGAPAPVTANKIVGMVQLKNIPFQWREAPKHSFCKCGDKKCTCGKQKPNKGLKIFEQKSKQKSYAKKALDRFRNKLNVAASETPASSLMQKLMSSINVAKEGSHMNIDSSICISKRASFYRTFANDLNKESDVVGTDMLFKNENYKDDLVQDALEVGENSSKLSVAHALLHKELIISRSSKDKPLPKMTKKCKCDLYEDLQRKWAHVKKSVRTISDVACKNPLSIMKNFCSSLFGPSCTIDTCPNKRAKKEKAKEEKNKSKTKKKDNKKPKKKSQMATQTIPKSTKKGQAAVQTQDLKDGETQLASSTEVQRQIADEMQKERLKEQEREKLKPQGTADLKTIKPVKDGCFDQRKESPCEVEKKMLAACEERERQKQMAMMKQNATVEPDCLTELSAPTMSEIPNTGDQRFLPVDAGVNVVPESATGGCQVIECPNYCHRSMQYEATGDFNIVQKSQAIGSVICLCDEAVQGDPQKLCTCATQHCAEQNNMGKTNPTTIQRSLTYTPRLPTANKKTQLRPMKQVANKGTHYTARKLQIMKKNKDMRSGGQKQKLAKLSLESSLCVLDRNPTVTEAAHDTLTDTMSDTSISSISIESDGTKTDTTICSLATFNDTPRRRRFRVKVITKTNQATLTDKTRLCDTGTITHDWWSPIIERKGNDEILLEKKKGYNAIEKQKKELRELKEWKELREVRRRRRNCGVTTDGRIVTFRSRTQIIPTGIFPGPNDIMSPSRYLLESQKYYNELFAYNFRPSPQMDYACMTQVPKYQEKDKTRSPVGSRRNHHRKTKRLDECYSPRRQLSPRKRYTESTKTSESPHRRSYAHRNSNNRHYSKVYSPRRI